MDKHDETASALGTEGREKYLGLSKHRENGACRAWISKSFSLVLPLSVCLLKVPEEPASLFSSGLTPRDTLLFNFKIPESLQTGMKNRGLTSATILI